jgi:hypothetical protein
MEWIVSSKIVWTVGKQHGSILFYMPKDRFVFDIEMQIVYNTHWETFTTNAIEIWVSIRPI